MLRLTIGQLESDMILAAPVFCPEQPDRVLLRSGYQISDAVIRRLARLDIEAVWVRCPSMADISRHLHPDVMAKRSAMVQEVRKVFESAQSEASAGLNYHAYRQAVTDLIHALLSHPMSVIMLEELAGTNTSLMGHCLRVSYLSLLVGLKLDAYLVQQRNRLKPLKAKNVTNLGLGAMLHDFGMISLMKKYGDLAEPDPRHEAEAEPAGDATVNWRTHIPAGVKLVREQVEPTVLAVIRDHHQRFDGSGFPAVKDSTGAVGPLAGGRIHVFPRIVAAVDVYDRLRHPAEGAGLTPVAALHAILQTEMVRGFDPRVLEAMIAVTPPYPPGHAVHLSDGRRVAVVRYQPDQPCRPVVCPLDGAGGDADDATAWIDLAEQRDLQVAAVDGQDVTPFNFDLPPARERTAGRA